MENKHDFSAFDDILYITDNDIRSVMINQIDLGDILPKALTGTANAVKGKFFRNMPYDIVRRVVTEMYIQGDISDAQTEEARQKIVDVIKQLISDEKLTLSDAKDEREVGIEMAQRTTSSLEMGVRGIDSSTCAGVIEACYHIAVAATRDGIKGLEKAAAHIKNNDFKAAIHCAVATQDVDELEELLGKQTYWGSEYRVLEAKIICEGILRMCMGETPNKLVERLRSMLPPGVVQVEYSEGMSVSQISEDMPPFAEIIENIYNLTIVTRREGIPGLESEAANLEHPPLSDAAIIAATTPDVEDLRYLFMRKLAVLQEYEEIKLSIIKSGILNIARKKSPDRVYNILQTLRPPEILSAEKPEGEEIICLTSMKIVEGKMSEFKRICEQQFVPMLEEQPGCDEVEMLEELGIEGGVAVLTVWKGRQYAEMFERSTQFNKLMEKLLPLFGESPMVKFYQLTDASE